MNEIWDKVYRSDASFFGDGPSNFALDCYEELKKHQVKRILELGCGQGRDSIFFASNNIDVVAIDSSQVAVDPLSKIVKEKHLSFRPMIHNANQGIPFDDSYFDAVYSHMFFNMRFSADRLNLLFDEVNRVLKKQGLNLFSVRSDHDTMYRKGTVVEKDIYEINRFQIRFFTKSDIEDIVKKTGFKLYKITEAYEEPVNLYCVFTKKITTDRQTRQISL
jgi:SAM-dependent methyltransferase